MLKDKVVASPTEEMSVKWSSPSSALIRSFLLFFALFRTKREKVHKQNTTHTILISRYSKLKRDANNTLMFFKADNLQHDIKQYFLVLTSRSIIDT